MNREHKPSAGKSRKPSGAERKSVARIDKPGHAGKIPGGKKTHAAPVASKADNMTTKPKLKVLSAEDERRIRKYLEYAHTEEAYAVLFVKKYLAAAAGKWVDILEIRDGFRFAPEKLEFRAVRCALFDRKIQPEYPQRADYPSEESYLQVCRAITWETAHEDIARQRALGEQGQEYRIEGEKHNVNRGKSYFTDDAPSDIRALAKNLNDRTNPLWDRAVRYIREEKWVFRVRSIRKYR